MKASDLIDRLGGTAKVARIAGVKMPAVSNWRQRDRIPPRLYLRISLEAQRIGIEVPASVFGEPSEVRREIA